MMREDKYCPGCHFNHPKDSPRLKIYKEVGCPELANHGYLCRKDVTASANVVYQFNTKFPKIPDQSCTNKPVAKRVSDDKASDHISARRVHSLSIPIPPLDPSVPPAPIEKNIIFLKNQAAPIPTYNGYSDVYSSDLEH